MVFLGIISNWHILACRPTPVNYSCSFTGIWCVHVINRIIMTHLKYTSFPLYFGTEIQRDAEVAFSKTNILDGSLYNRDSITAIFNIYFCDYGTVLVDSCPYISFFSTGFDCFAGQYYMYVTVVEDRRKILSPIYMWFSTFGHI